MDKALGLYNRLYDEAVKRHDADPAYGNRQIRTRWRTTSTPRWCAWCSEGWEAKKANRPLAGYDVYPPFDVGFSVKATVVDPRVVRFEGTWNVLPVGTRIRVVLRDKEYPNGRPAGMEWDQGDSVNLDPPRDKTFMQDQLFVRNRRFNKRIDMSKDVTMYPFISDKYLLEFYYSPRSAPPHIQDKFGWNGEGLTDKHFLRTDLKENQRVIYASFELTRDQILRRGEWADRTPVFRTTNYVDADASSKADVLVDIPSLRSGK